MLDADGAAAGAEELGVVDAAPPQAVRLSRAAAATPATVKDVRLNDCISVLLVVVGADFLPAADVVPAAWPFPTVGHLPLAGVSMGIRPEPGSGWVDRQEFLNFLASPGGKAHEGPGVAVVKRQRSQANRPGISVSVCARGDLNPHARRHRNLNPACLPISPLALGSSRRSLGPWP
jgi:hypothetical protein